MHPKKIYLWLFITFFGKNIASAQLLGKEERGKASFYAQMFNGRLTSCGERFNQNELTAAHRTLPFNTMLKVTNVVNNHSVIVRVNDRGSYR